MSNSGVSAKFKLFRIHTFDSHHTQHFYSETVVLVGFEPGPCDEKPSPITELHGTFGKFSPR